MKELSIKHKNYRGIILDRKIIDALAEKEDFYNFRLIAEQFKIDYYPFLSKGEGNVY